jgi:hypothetical protein
MRTLGSSLLLPTLLLAFISGCDGSNGFALGIASEDVGPGLIGGAVLRNDVGVDGVRVVLIGRDSTETDSNGEYLFDRLRPGVYPVAIRIPPGSALKTGQTLIRNANVASRHTTRIEWLLSGSGDDAR